MTRTSVSSLLAALCFAWPAAAADSIRCDGGTVSVGDTRIDLLARCGAPALQEVEPAPPARFGDPAVAVPIERWTYNFGPQRFLQIVSLRGGRVIAVERGSYGYDPPDAPRSTEGDKVAIPRARCAHDAFRVGDRSFEVLARCGEPASRELRQVQQRVVEVWVYDFGPNQLIRLLDFEGGTLARIRTGNYGYSR